MKKIILLAFITLLTFSYGRMVDGIALVVEGEPVTTAEILAVQKQMQISKKEATDLLIQDRLQKSAMKDIKIEEKLVDTKIAGIAAQNSLTIPKMQKILKQQGTSWTKYRTSIRNALKKEKFYREKVLSSIPKPNEDELKLFYRNHKEDFILPKSIRLIEYSAKTEASMKKFLGTKNTRGIKSRSVTKSAKDLNPALLRSILQTQDGSFTRPLNAGDRYISYKVLSKEGQVTMPYETAKGAVAAKWKQEQRNKALKDYFEKLKTNADIRVLR